jgi:hypothetical protein
MLGKGSEQLSLHAHGIAEDGSLCCTWLVAGYDILIENLTDPSHLPHSHHNLSPVLTREKGGSMPFTDLLKKQQHLQKPEAELTTTSSSSSGAGNGDAGLRQTSSAVSAAHPILGMTQPLSAKEETVEALQQVCAFNFPSALAEDGIIVFNPPTNVVYNYAQVHLFEGLVMVPRMRGGGKTRMNRGISKNGERSKQEWGEG